MKPLSFTKKPWVDIAKEEKKANALLLSHKKILQQIEDLKNKKIVASSFFKQIVPTIPKPIKIVHAYLPKHVTQNVIQMENELWDENPKMVFQKIFPKNLLTNKFDILC